MKELTQYNYAVMDAMHKYLKGEYNVTRLIAALREVEKHARRNYKGKEKRLCALWFKFSKDDTLARDIRDINSMFMEGSRQPESNKQLLREDMQYAIDNASIRVFFS